VDYDDESTIVEALKGIQFLVNTIGFHAPPDTEKKLIKAAAKAGVTYIMPSFYGYDPLNIKFQQDLFGPGAVKILKDIENLNGPAYVVLASGFWYEWSLSLGESWYGFDIKTRTVTFFDDGKTKINTSTWSLCGQALAGLLSLPMAGTSPAIEDWKNKPLYISSFRISQRDMLDSLHRVLNTTDDDWIISFQSTEERQQKGRAAMEQGDITGFAKALYSRTFYPNGDADYETLRGLHNKTLVLPTEDLDVATKRAVDMAMAGYNPFS
jgi:hypothetical protein